MMMERKNTILIVDDEEIIKKSLEEVLKDEYNILQAENGQVALDMLAKHAKKIVVIVLDMVMPVMLGKEGLARAGGTDQQNITFLKLYLTVFRQVDPLIVVIHSHRKGDLCLLLADDVTVHVLLHLHRSGQMFRHILLIKIIFQQIAAGLDTLAADIHTGASDQPGLVFPLTAKAATNGIFFFRIRHIMLPPFGN